VITLVVDIVLVARRIWLSEEHGWWRDESVLLIRRGKPPFEGALALPGGKVKQDELLLDAAKRELFEETGVAAELRFHSLCDSLDRDPRGRFISAVYVGVLEEAVVVRAGDDAADAGWVPVKALPPLAFDHAEVVRSVLG
jgi:8-oxo-dGTP diphosphatase